ncbi:hypothetical protein ACFL3H_08645, partial [Gemmatimonadota bacterium]
RIGPISDALFLERGCHLEGQVVAVADEIAQQTHDLEDGLREGQVDLGGIEDLAISRLVLRNFKNYSDLPRFVRQNRLIRGLIHLLVTNTIVSSMKRIGAWCEAEEITTPEGYREALDSVPRTLVHFDSGLADEYRQLHRFVYTNIINCYSVSRMDGKSVFLIRKLFKAYLNRPLQLPDYVLLGFAKRHRVKYLRDFPLDAIEEEGVRYRTNPAFYRAVCDFIAGMTDKFVFDEYEKLYIPGERV